MDFDDAVPEDLTLLPVGFYDYFAPLLTGLLVDGVNWDGKPWIAGKSVALDRSKKPGDDVGNDEFKLDVKTGASVFYVERLRTTLTRAYQCGRKAFQFDDNAKARLALLFGVAPLAFATGNLDVLRETFEWEKENLDGKCRETIRRLLGDAEE